MLINIFETFSASLRSVGTACTLAAVGIYLHRRNFIVGDGKRTLALISQQVTIPAFLFSKIVYCNQDWSDEPCPNVTDSLNDIWMLLVWPIYVVIVGLVVGAVVSRVSGTPKSQQKSVLAACAFGNSTGLPITLLTVIHANFSSNTELGRVDPTLFLSVYLLLYPVLQWALGGWLLSPGKDEEEDTDGIHGLSQPAQLENVLNDKFMQSYYAEGRRGMPDTDASLYISDADLGKLARTMSEMSDGNTSQEEIKIQKAVFQNVLNQKMLGKNYYKRHRGIGETDASLYISDRDLTRHDVGNGSHNQLQKNETPNGTQNNEPKSTEGETGNDFFISNSEGDLMKLAVSEDDQDEKKIKIAWPASDNGGAFFIPNSDSESNMANATSTPNEQLIPLMSSPKLTKNYTNQSLLTATSIKEEPGDNQSSSSASTSTDKISCLTTLREISSRVCQPPVIGAVLGLLVASTPLRGIFVDLVDRADRAPLEWFFDGLYATGQAAVPVNMIILGCNLSAAQRAQKGDDLFSFKTMCAMVVGKMVVMPIVGIVSAVVLKTYFWDVPTDIDASFYLVAMIVFITPTANNVMVMVELSGSGTKEGIAQVIGFQYLVAPILLSFSVTCVVGVASQWSE